MNMLAGCYVKVSRALVHLQAPIHLQRRMYVCMYVCMYVTCVCTYSRYVLGWAISESVYACTYTNVCICVINFLPIYAHVNICEFVCMYVCMCIHVYCNNVYCFSSCV